MLRCRVEDAFDVSAEAYWNLFFFDEAYNVALYSHLRLARQQLSLEREGEGPDTVVRRVLRLTPDREIPLVLRKLVTDKIHYEERNVFTARDNIMEIKIVPAFFSGRVESGGTYELIPQEGDKIIRVYDGYCKCSIPILGKKVEEFIIGEVRKSFVDTTNFTRRWIANHPAQE